MLYEQLSVATKNELATKRWEHTLRVVDTAIGLAEHHRFEDLDKVKIAALLHDYCKCWQTEKLSQHLDKYTLDGELNAYDKELWHGPVAASVVKDKFNILDPEIQAAIYYHTTGRPAMSQLEQIIFLADYIEPARNYEGIALVRERAYNSLDEAMLLALDQIIKSLILKARKIFPMTILARNFYLDLRLEGEGCSH